MYTYAEPRDFNHQNLLFLKTTLKQSWDQILEKSASTPTNWKNNIPEKFIQSIELNFRNGRSTDYYAREMQTSRSNLRKVCKGAFGIPPGTCINIRLMMEAHQLLETPCRTIKETAMSLGFNDPAYFTRFFRKHAGICPEDYRRAFFGHE